jgi:hypothetical protein
MRRFSGNWLATRIVKCLSKGYHRQIGWRSGVEWACLQKKENLPAAAVSSNAGCIIAASQRLIPAVRPCPVLVLISCRRPINPFDGWPGQTDFNTASFIPRASAASCFPVQPSSRKPTRHRPPALSRPVHPGRSRDKHAPRQRAQSGTRCWDRPDETSG